MASSIEQSRNPQADEKEAAPPRRTLPAAGMPTAEAARKRAVRRGANIHIQDEDQAPTGKNAGDDQAAAEVDRLHVFTMADEQDQVLATLIATMEAIGARVRALADDLVIAATLVERAQGLANMLPHKTMQQRVAANEIAEHVRGMQELTQRLGDVMEEQLTDARRGQKSDARESNPQVH